MDGKTHDKAVLPLRLEVEVLDERIAPSLIGSGGYEGQPGNQAGGGTTGFEGQPGNQAGGGTTGYEGQPGNQSGG